MDKRKNAGDTWYCYLVWAVAFVVAVMLLAGIFTYKNLCCWDERGQFGDMFGVVNALFSGLAFAGLIVTILQQHKALEQTREDLKNQTEEFDEQNKTLRIQRFENTFFKMLEVQQNIVNDFYAADSEHNEYHGRNLFYYVVCSCKHNVSEGDKKLNGLREVIYYKGLSHVNDYMTMGKFDHYFLHLYTILKFIKEKEWLGDEKQYQYATFIRATLSRFELFLLYYHGLNHPEMKKMMERYCLLHHLRKDFLPMSQEYSCFLGESRLSQKSLHDAGFSDGDFEYYLTDDEDDDSRYHLCAFYTNDEMEKGKELLDRWRKLVNFGSNDK